MRASAETQEEQTTALAGGIRALEVGARLDVKTLFIEPGSPWENGYNESFNGTLRDELLEREIIYTQDEARVLIWPWSREYDHFRPHRSAGMGHWRRLRVKKWHGYRGHLNMTADRTPTSQAARHERVGILTSVVRGRGSIWLWVTVKTEEVKPRSNID